MERSTQRADSLQAEGEALRSTFERIDFLVSQGFLSEADAARKKQNVIDSFCLAPMVNRHRSMEEGGNAANPGGVSVVETVFGCGMPMAWLSMTAGRTVDIGQSSSQNSQEGGQSAAPSHGGQVQGAAATDSGGNQQNEIAQCRKPASLGDEGGHARAPADKQVEGRKPRNPPSTAEETLPSLSREGSPPRDVAPPRASQSSRSGSRSGNGSGSEITGHVATPTSSQVPSPVRDPTTVPIAKTTGNAGESSASHAVPSREPRSVDPKPPERSLPPPPPPPPPPLPPPPPPPDGTNATSASTADGSASHAKPTATAVPTACVVVSDNSATCTEEQNALQTRSVEAEPAPPAVPDPAELKRGKCEWPKCTREPHYAMRGERARTCYLHKREGWVHVSRRRCDMEGCPRGAYFSRVGSETIFCSEHRSPTMVDVVNLRRYTCQGPNCDRQAYYNFPGSHRTASKARFCSTHKMPNMINVRHRLCQMDGCGTTPTYSFPKDRPRFCAAHKEPGMVDTKSKMCAFIEPDGSNCPRCRLYGEPEGKATFCLEHKKDGMVNIRQARKRQRS